MIAEIIPHLRLVRSLSVFDYLIPSSLSKNLQRGSFVVIPWRGRQAVGMVWNIKAKSEIPEAKLASVREVLDFPLFSSADCDLLEWFARAHGVSLGHAFKTFIPSIPLRETPFVSRSLPRLEQTTISPTSARDVRESLQKAFAHRLTAVRFPDADFMAAWYYGIIAKLAPSEQLLIVVPEIRDIDALRSRLGKAAQKRIAVFHSEQSKNESLQERKRAASALATIIIGTKLAVFVPIKNLRIIIVHDESNDGHRQSDQNPRFDAREVARTRAELHNARFVVCGASLSLRSEAAICDGDILDASPSLHPRVFRSIELGGQELASPVGHLLREAIAVHLEVEQKIFLFLDKRGVASFVQCDDCKHLVACPECGLLLRVVKKRGAQFMMCFRSSSEFPLPLACPQCAGTRMILRGWGTERIESDIRESFASYRIQRIDSLSGEIPLHETDLFVGTEYAFKRLPWKDIGMVGIIHLNGLLQLPSYEAAERAWRILATIRFCARRDAEIILQSIASIPTFFVTGDRERYVLEESLNRKPLLYPPFGRLLIFRTKDSTEDNAAEFRLQLAARFPNASFISDPILRESRGQATAAIIVKLPSKTTPKLSLRGGRAPVTGEAISHLHSLDFSWVPDHWIVDVDPPSLLAVQ